MSLNDAWAEATKACGPYDPGSLYDRLETGDRVTEVRIHGSRFEATAVLQTERKSDRQCRWYFLKAIGASPEDALLNLAHKRRAIGPVERAALIPFSGWSAIYG